MQKSVCWLSVSMVVLGLSGCASMSVEECQSAHWQRIGEREGIRGEGSQLARHYKACQKANIVPDQTQYEQGYSRGLALYCTTEQVFQQALQGKGDYQFCPVQKQAQLRPYYQVANDYYQAKQQLTRLEDDFYRVRERLADTKLSEKNRRSYHSEYQRLRRDLSATQRDYREAEQTLRDFKYRNNLY